MDFAYVDKLAKESNGVTYLLVLQEFFDRPVIAKGKRTKDSEETVKAFSPMISQVNWLKRSWVDKGTEVAGVFEKFCAAEGKQVYSTMSEIRAAFLNVQHDHWKIFFAVTWKVLDTSIYTDYLNLSPP